MSQFPSALSSTALNASVGEQVNALERNDLSIHTINSMDIVEHVDASNAVAEVHRNPAILYSEIVEM